MVLVNVKPGMTVMKSKYVFKIKKKFEKISRYKAKLVALGSAQKINPQLNFAPVEKPNVVRMLMALAIKLLKSLYGLRTLPKSRNKTIDKTLREMHFESKYASYKLATHSLRYLQGRFECALEITGSLLD
jgi:hypothetical protein